LNSGSPRPIHDSKLLRDADVRGLAASGVFVWVGTSAGLFVVPAFRSGSADLQQYFSDTVSSHVLIRGPEGIVATGRPQSNNRDNSEGTVITGITVDGQSWPTPFLRTKRARLTLPWRARLVEIRFVNPRVESQSSGAYLIRTGRSDGLGGSFSDIPEPWTQMRISNAGQIRGDIFVPLSRDDAAVTANWPRRRDMGPIVLRRSRGDSPASAFMSRHIATADENGWLWLPDEAERRIVIEHPSRTLAPGLHRVVVYANAGGRGDSASVEFVVAQAPWVRWWFAGPILVALTGAGVTYRRRRRRRTEEIARLRARIAADLHDSVGASLSRIAILSDVVASQVGGHVPKAGSSLKAIGENARSAIDEMSDAVWFIDPGSRNVGDMLARIRTVAAELFEPDLVSWSVDAEARVSDVPLTSEQRRHAYLIVKEALTNVRRHAEPSLVQVRLTMTTTGLRIEIDDDGDAPIPISVERAGNGIANMRARAQELGGTLAIEPRPGGGTRVVVQTTLR
jgi:anti-sigma regulatory factor (Ser/Thr protein kinase)